MRRYESIIIIDPETSEEEHTSILNKINDLVNRHGGLLIGTENWGVKKTAYEIKKKSRGHYIRFDFCSEVSVVREMEYFFRINDNIMKFMTVVLEKKVNLEAIKSTLTEAKQSEETKDDDTELKDQEEKTETPESETTTVDEGE